MSKMTKEEIAKELLDPYFIDPDLCSHVDGECLYKGPGGRKCVFAAACVEGVVLKESIGSDGHIRGLGAEILEEKYRHIANPEFWRAVQRVHDYLAVDYPDAYTLYADLVGQEPPKRGQGNV